MISRDPLPRPQKPKLTQALSGRPGLRPSPRPIPESEWRRRHPARTASPHSLSRRTRRRDARRAELVQRVMLDQNHSDSPQEQTECSKEQNVNARLSRKVRTRKRDLAKVQQTDLGDSQTHHAQRQDMPHALPRRPQAYADRSGSQPYGNTVLAGLHQRKARDNDLR